MADKPELIDKVKLLEWLEKFYVQSVTEAENHPDRDRRMYCEGHAHLAKELAAKIHDGAFDPLAPVPPKFKEGDWVRHKKWSDYLEEYKRGKVTGYSKSGKSVMVSFEYLGWNQERNFSLPRGFNPNSIELLKEEQHEEN